MFSVCSHPTELEQKLDKHICYFQVDKKINSFPSFSYKVLISPSRLRAMFAVLHGEGINAFLWAACRQRCLLPDLPSAASKPRAERRRKKTVEKRKDGRSFK